VDPRLYRQLREIERSHWWFTGRRRIVLSALERLDVRAESILDVGCGAGTNLELLGERYPQSSICGIDVELDPLRFCLEDRSVPVLQAAAERLPFDAASFDLISAFDTLEHVADDEAALQDLYRVCRPGGALLVTVPAFPFLWGNVDETGRHYRRYIRHDLVSRVEGAGFSVRFVRFFNYLLFTPIAAIRLAARVLPPRGAGDSEVVRTDFDVVKSGPLNAFLAMVFSLEASLLGLNPPFGVSLLCVAERRAG
jgi:SAM-dependent methyltransferase